MEHRLDVSVVVPVLDGAGTLRELFAGLQRTMTELELQFEAIFVDDGSTDNTWQTIVALKAEHGELVRGFRLARNSGQQAATYCGLLEARGDWAVTIDDDLQPHPREIAKLWSRAQATRADLVYGKYATLHSGLVHRVGTRLFRALWRRIVPGGPDGSAFRLIRSAVLKGLPRNVGPWVLVDPVLAWQTSSATSILVDHGRRTGRSRYTFSELFGMACTILFTYSRTPLRLMTGLGLLSSAVSFGLGLYYLIQKITVGAQIGFSALIVTTAFASGVILLNLGILGEYISRIHTMGSGEPAFAVKARV